MQKWFPIYKNLAVILLNTLLLLVLLNVGLHYFYRYKDRKAKKSNPVSGKYGAGNLKKVYPDLTEAEIDELLTETWNRPHQYAPFTAFQETPFTGKYVNVHPAGFRHSGFENPWPLDTTRFNIFVFGGSTTFGYGVADNQTIPAFLQKTLSKTQPKVAVYNFGTGYFYSEQERVFFEKLLLQGKKPNLVIFIDGLNDFYMKQPFFTPEMQQLFRKEPSYLFGKWFESTPIKRLATSLNYRLFGINPPAFDYQESCHPDSIQPLIDRYLNNKNLTEAVAKHAQVPVYFVWQPVSCYQYSPPENLFKQDPKDCFPGCAYSQAEKRKNEFLQNRNLLWLADLTKKQKQFLYVDQAHYSPVLNKLIAEKVGEFLNEKTGR